MNSHWYFLLQSTTTRFILVVSSAYVQSHSLTVRNLTNKLSIYLPIGLIPPLCKQSAPPSLPCGCIPTRTPFQTPPNHALAFSSPNSGSDILLWAASTIILSCPWAQIFYLLLLDSNVLHWASWTTSSILLGSDNPYLPISLPPNTHKCSAPLSLLGFHTLCYHHQHHYHPWQTPTLVGLI